MVVLHFGPLAPELKEQLKQFMIADVVKSGGLYG